MCSGYNEHRVCQLSFVSLGKLCVSLVDESWFGSANHYIKGTEDEQVLCVMQCL